MSSIIFDQYQRYKFIERVITLRGTNKTERILEVGAIGSPLRNMLSGYRPVMLDQDAGPLDLRANGLHLPFRDSTFDVVINTDVLEHINTSERAPFIHELQRVASGVLILGFPHFEPRNVLADKIFYDFIKDYSGLDFQYLKEHAHYGLPEVDDIRQHVRSFMPHILEFKNANIASWLLLQLGNFVLFQNPALEEVRSLMNEFFDQSLEAASHNPPCYRTFLVCSKQPLSDELNRALEGVVHRSEGSVEEYASKFFAIVNASEATMKQKSEELAALEDKLRQQMEEIQDLNADINALKQEIDHLETETHSQALANQNLQDYLNLFLQHPAYKIYKFFKK